MTNCHSCTESSICDFIFQIDEISNHHNLFGTICEPIFKAYGSSYFSINMGLLKKEKTISVLMILCCIKSKKIRTEIFG